MQTTARVPQAEITGLYGSLVTAMSRKMLGKVPDSLGVMWHHKAVLKDVMTFGRKSERWHELDPHLATLAVMATAATIGCGACLDLHYFKSRNTGLDLAKAREVPRWRESEVFTPLERQVMEYAEAMSRTPPTVTDELSAALLDELGAPGLLELTARVATMNLMSRSNVALGIRAEGLADACGLEPLAQPSGAVASSA